jgi:hypothetical protein
MSKYDKLSNVQLLMVRACKMCPNDTTTRMESIRRRFYVKMGNQDITLWAISMLSPIVDKICPYTASEWVEVYSKYEYGNIPTLTYNEYMTKVLSSLCSKIALTSVSQIPGWRELTYFKNKRIQREKEQII